MSFFRKQASIIAIFVCYLLLTACDETKVVQCNKLIQVVNKGNALIDSKKDNSDVASTKNLANALNKTAKELDTLDLTETNLKGFQTRLSKGFRELSEPLNDMAKALDTGKNASTTSEGREQIEKAKKDLAKAGQAANKAAKNQDALTSKLAVYCSK
ncbi:hypothetical protein [Kamptonema sp. UHCC 0994]|uniref:hypothetical protein n=1 Tax=Kamptonema sp. UHCC 0994 TaxID=3031329 RepID=UPI0023B94D6D|nr:hypothetical protein [Kamptonema sp. UHCC 0994]MDF0554548.1 hypothetical protein [Kamptonema sp. UHCC 0994]